MQKVSNRRVRGFSLLETVVVVAIILIVSAISVTIVNTAIQSSHLRGTANRYVELMQTTRSRAATDDRFYTVYIQPAAGANEALAYADIFPQAVNGVSGKGPTGSYTQGDPVITIASDVQMQLVGAAPNTAALKTSFCPTCILPIVLNEPPTWGPDGMPCKSNPSIDASATVCNSAGGPKAYWTFFQSRVNGAWAAVTITPAGRVRAWDYAPNSGTWSAE